MAAIAFLALALRSGLDEAEGSVIPQAGWIAASAVFGVPSVIAAAHSWVALLPDDFERRRLLRMFYATQLWRHLPAGGAAQMAGQISLTRRSGVPTARAALASPIAVMTSLVAAGCLGAMSVVTGLHDVRFAPALTAGLGSLVLLRRGSLVRFLSVGRRWVRRLPDEEHVPSQAALVRSFLWGGGALVAHGMMLSLLLHHAGGASSLAIISANSVAWAVGVLALPAPSGLGVREGVLIALLGGSVPTSTLLGAALIQRLVLLVAELVTVLAVTASARLRLAIDR